MRDVPRLSIAVREPIHPALNEDLVVVASINDWSELSAALAAARAVIDALSGSRNELTGQLERIEDAIDRIGSAAAETAVRRHDLGTARN